MMVYNARKSYSYLLNIENPSPNSRPEGTATMQWLSRGDGVRICVGRGSHVSYLGSTRIHQDLHPAALQLTLVNPQVRIDILYLVYGRILRPDSSWTSRRVCSGDSSVRFEAGCMFGSSDAHMRDLKHSLPIFQPCPIVCIWRYSIIRLTVFRYLP